MSASFFSKDRGFLVLVLVLASRFLFLSGGLDEWDSVQYALAVRDFDVVSHQPHPPGYPLYVFLARFFFVFLGNELDSLLMINLFLSPLGAFFFYRTLLVLTGKNRGSFFFTVLFITNPLVWSRAELPLTDTASLSLLLGSVYFLTKLWAGGSVRIAGLVGFFLGASVGMRPDNLFFASAAFLVLFFWLKRRVVPARVFSASLLLFFAVAGACFLLMVGSHDLAELSEAFFERGSDARLDSFLFTGSLVKLQRSLVFRLVSAFAPWGENVLWGLYEADFLDPWLFALSVFCFAFFSAVAFLSWRRGFAPGFLVFLFFSVSLFDVFVHLFLPRYFLPSLALFYLLLGALFLRPGSSFSRGVVLRLGVFYFCALSLFSFALLPVLWQLSPGVELAEYVASNYDASATVVVSEASATRHLGYYAEGFPVCVSFSPKNCPQLCGGGTVLLAGFFESPRRVFVERVERVGSWSRSPLVCGRWDCVRAVLWRVVNGSWVCSG